MLNCKQVTRLVSQSMDTRLTWSQRLAIRFHLLYCIWCRRYTAQIQFLRQATKGVGADTADSTRLSEEAKEQMRKRLREAQNEPPASLR